MIPGSMECAAQYPHRDAATNNKNLKTARFVRLAGRRGIIRLSAADRGFLRDLARLQLISPTSPTAITMATRRAPRCVRGRTSERPDWSPASLSTEPGPPYLGCVGSPAVPS